MLRMHMRELGKGGIGGGERTIFHCIHIGSSQK